MKWRVVYERAIREDGSLLFPERLTKEFLADARRTLGSYLFANNYQNEVIPEDEKRFKPGWLRLYREIPRDTYRFAFIDPAIGQKDRHDYTGVAVIDVDTDGHWYLRIANRYRLTPTQIVDKVFDIHKQFNCQAIGVEAVAYQEALIYLLSEQMRDRKTTLPVKAIKRTAVSKNTRILSLVPRFEWGGISIAQGLVDFEDEYNTFPRGSHDDLLDSVASLEEVVFYPEKEKKSDERPASAQHPDYERYIIKDIARRSASQEE